MKNKTSILFAFVILAAIGLGCSSINPFSGSKETGSSSSDSKDKTTADKVVDTSVGESRIGVPECDEVSDLIEIELKNPDDGYFTKAIKRTYFNRIKDGIRESVEKNKNDTTELAKTCAEFKKQYDKFKAEEETKKDK